MNIDKLINHLDEYGYMVVPNFLDKATTAAIRAHIDNFAGPVAPLDKGDAQRLHIMRHPIAGELMPKLASRPELLDLAMKTLRIKSRADLRLLEQVLIRTDPAPPPYGAGGWHVDMAFLPQHYDCTPRGTYFHMVHLCNDVKAGGGAFMIVPGSHKTTYAWTSKLDKIDDAEAYRNKVIELAGVDPSKGVEVPGNDGDLLVFNPMCLHSASRNSTNQSRYVYFASFMDKSATYLREHLRKTKYRDNFPDSLRKGLPAELAGLLEY